MAHAAVLSLIHTLTHILDSPRPLILYDTPQLQTLIVHLHTLLELLETCPTNTFGDAFEPLSVKIRNRAYEAEDMIETCVYSYHSAGFHSILTSCVNLLSSLPLPGLFDWGMRLRYRHLWRFIAFDRVSYDVIDIIRQVNEFRDSNLIASSFSVVDPSVSNHDSVTSFNDNKVFVGQKDEFDRIKGRLVGPVPRHLQVIAIFGMGGIGKTTLARKVYDDPSIKDWFDVRVWLKIGQEFEGRKTELVKELVDSLPKLDNQKKESEKKEETLAELTVQLYKTLYKRRYLIVLDGVWDTDVWDYFQTYFSDTGNCSRVILTTRNEQVAAQAGGSSTSTHVMKGLSDDECWELLRAEVFGRGFDSPDELVASGMEIASSCKGLPLVVIVIAGLLFKGNRTLNEWEHLAVNLRSVVADDAGVAEILLLSYKHLPQHLKACFLYIGVFLECYRIPVSKIVKLLVAEGFVQQVSDKTLEQVAEEYIRDLVGRSLVSVGRRKENGRIKTIFIHDLLRELCIREAQKENLIQDVNRDMDCTLQGTNSPRRLSLDSYVFNDSTFYIVYSPMGNIPAVGGSSGYSPFTYEHARIFLNRDKAEYLIKPFISLRVRSLLYTGKKPIQTISNFMLLRVLDKPHVQHFTFPMEILKLVHLRFLAFPYFGEIPESISQLYNLETVIFSSLFKKTAPCPTPLPLAIWSLPKLRHFKFLIGYLRDFPCVLPGWRNFSFLGNLQSLSDIHASFCTNEVLDEVPNLKKLGIWIEEWFDAPIYVNNLTRLKQLEVLKCTVRPFRGHNVLPFQHYDFVPAIVFPTGLKEITLSGCRIPWAYMNVVGSLPNLEKLKLKDDAFVGKSWTTSDDEFVKLQFLTIDTSNMVNWIVESVHFPSLRSLLLRSCLKLNEIPSDIAEIETLELITIHSCSASATNSAKQIVEEQKNNGNESLELHLS